MYYQYGSGRFWLCVSNYSDLLPTGLQEAGKWCKYQNGQESMRTQGARRGPEPPAGPGLAVAMGTPPERGRAAGGPSRESGGGRSAAGRARGELIPGCAGGERRAQPSPASGAGPPAAAAATLLGELRAGASSRGELHAAPPSSCRGACRGEPPCRWPKGCAGGCAEGKVAAPSPGAARPPARRGLTGPRAAGSEWKWPCELPPAAAPRAGRGCLPWAPPGRWEPAVPAAPGRAGRGSPCSEPCRVLGSGFVSFFSAGKAAPSGSGGGPARCAPRRRLPRCPSVRRRPRRWRPAAGDALPAARSGTRFSPPRLAR